MNQTNPQNGASATVAAQKAAGDKGQFGALPKASNTPDLGSSTHPEWLADGSEVILIGDCRGWGPTSAQMAKVARHTASQVMVVDDSGRERRFSNFRHLGTYTEFSGSSSARLAAPDDNDGRRMLARYRAHVLQGTARLQADNVLKKAKVPLDDVRGLRKALENLEAAIKAADEFDQR